MNKGLVSVVIPVYNRSEFLEDCLNSVREQTYDNWEIILCDDGSSAEVADKIDQLAAMCRERARVFHLPHAGAGPARESGRQAARGEFIQYLDSDDRLLSPKLQKQVDALEKRPECGIAYGKARLIDREGCVLNESYKEIEERAYLFPRLLVERWWCTHSPLYRKTVCDRVGPWSDLRYSQDWEYDARAGAMKIQLAFIDEVLSEHRKHDSAVRQTGHGRWLEPEEQVRFFESLFDCAMQAGISIDTPEMRHFVRWVFASARFAAIQGDADSASHLMRQAFKATDEPSLDIRMFRGLAELVGWCNAGRLISALHRVVGQTYGSHTLRQSWMRSGLS